MFSEKRWMIHVFPNFFCFKILVTFNGIPILSKTENEKITPDLFIVYDSRVIKFTRSFKLYGWQLCYCFFARKR